VLGVLRRSHRTQQPPGQLHSRFRQPSSWSAVPYSKLAGLRTRRLFSTSRPRTTSLSCPTPMPATASFREKTSRLASASLIRSILASLSTRLRLILWRLGKLWPERNVRSELPLQDRRQLHRRQCRNPLDPNNSSAPSPAALPTFPQRSNANLWSSSLLAVNIIGRTFTARAITCRSCVGINSTRDTLSRSL
jgi:hypothetical protein